MTVPFTLHRGDCIEQMRPMPDNSVDSVVCDPPYEIGMMGRSWDSTCIAFNVNMWREALRVLKPGGYLLAFSGSRTYHRMTVAIEDAGFEVRDRFLSLCGPSTKYGALWDSLNDEQRGALAELLNDQLGLGSEMAWTYGSGFPKSKNLTGDWKGLGTALKPAHEPICVARKPLAKGATVAANVLRHGTGALNIDGCRVEHQTINGGNLADNPHLRGTKLRGAPRVTAFGREGDETALTSQAGRWPANVLHDGSDEVIALFPDAKGQQGRARTDGEAQGNNTYGALKHISNSPEPRGDTGSAARFFYCAKASRADRNEGCSSSDAPAVDTGATMRECEDADWSARNGNHHPTVKPTELMAYLVRLVTPPGGVVLDPFMGSGTTGKACMREGFQFVGIDKDEDENGQPLGYLDIARARIKHELARVIAANTPSPPPPQLDLFAMPTGEGSANAA